jgi:hypothetical protein
MKALMRVKSVFPKLFFGFVTSLCLAGSAIADVPYVYDPTSTGYLSHCGCHQRYRSSCHRHKVKKKVRHYNSCYRKKRSCGSCYRSRCRSSYRIQVFYPQAVCCNSCVNCYSNCTPCAAPVRRPSCSSCNGRWYRQSGSSYDWDTRTADDVYSDF